MTSYLPASTLTSTLILPGLVSTSVQTIFVTLSLPGTTLYSNLVAPPSISTAYQTITLSVIHTTSTAVLPVSTELVTQTPPAGPPVLENTRPPVGLWANTDIQAIAVQTRTVTTTSMLPGTVVTSTAFLPGLTLEQTVSLTLFRTVTAVLTQRETLNFYVTSTLPQQTLTRTIYATTVLSQAIIPVTPNACADPVTIEVRTGSFSTAMSHELLLGACFAVISEARSS